MTSVSGAFGDGRRNGLTANSLRAARGANKIFSSRETRRSVPTPEECVAGMHHAWCIRCARCITCKETGSGKAGERATSFALLKRMMMPGFKARLTRSQRGV